MLLFFVYWPLFEFRVVRMQFGQNGRGRKVDSDRESKWPAIVFFMTSGIFFFGCVCYLTAGAMHPEYYWQAPPSPGGDQAGRCLPEKGPILLVKNQAVRIEGTRIVYRGIRDGALFMEMFILALDPHYGYPHRIDEHRAHHGFSIGEYHFQVLVASDDKISLQRL